MEMHLDIDAPQPSGVVCALEPDPAVRDSLVTLLEVEGLSVVTFATARAFFHALPDLYPDLVICEAQLPDSDGYRVHADLQAHRRDTLFVLLSSDREERHGPDARRCGISHVLRKPIVDRQLLSLISTSGSTD
ncbi:MAG: response regulator [Pseudomonadaceae bacterium]|nr:response regulator [Pseudomonadaceae bacterium]